MKSNIVEVCKNSVTDKDREILRALAKKQREYAESDRNRCNEQEWYRHRRFENGRPLIVVEMDTFEHEIIPQKIKCETELGQKIETTLYRNFLNFELFEDDKVVADFFPINWLTWFHLFDVVVDVTHATTDTGGNLGHQFNHVINSLDEDMANLKQTTYGVDKEGTLAYKTVVEEIIGDILPVKLNGSCIYVVPTQDLVHLMGMENMFLAMYDKPELLKNMMDRIADDYINYIRFLESENLLMTTTGNQHLGQGTLCYTEELPSNKNSYLSLDLWGFMDSQETVGIAPSMFGEFFFPAYKRIAQEVGLLSYGCCEPVHDIWIDYLSTLPNLRNISISPWCDEVFMGNQLRGKKVIFHRKPSPNYLGVHPELDEKGLRDHIRKTIEAAQGCQLEFAQRDVYTIHHNVDKVRRYVEIIKEECSLK